MAGWKVYLDINNDGTLEENEEPFDVMHNTGYYEFEGIVSQDYIVTIDGHKNWNLITPLESGYNLSINKGQEIYNLNFNVEKINGKSN